MNHQTHTVHRYPAAKMPLNDRNLKLASQIGPLLQITHTTPLSNPSMLVSTDTVPYQTAPHHTTPNPQPYTHPSQNLKPKPHKIPLRIPPQQATPQTQQAAPPGRPPANQLTTPNADIPTLHPSPRTTPNQPRRTRATHATTRTSARPPARAAHDHVHPVERASEGPRARRESRLRAHLDDDDDDDNACKSPQGNQPRTTAPTDRPTRE